MIIYGICIYIYILYIICFRFFHGDGPAAQFECGNQKGGHYFCVTCGIHRIMTDDFAHSGYVPIRTFRYLYFLHSNNIIF